MKYLEKTISTVKFRHENFDRKEVVEKQLLEVFREIHPRRKLWTIANFTRSIAATIAIAVLSVSGFFGLKVDYIADTDMSVSLPDHSTVELTSGAHLSYNRLMWMFRRSVSLKGKARFEVSKGKQFTVRTALGDISVLGTEFSVEAQAEELVVECYTGAVQVEACARIQVLRSDERVECSPDGMVFSKIEPAYLGFDGDPLNAVIAQIERIYGVHIYATESYADIRFNGIMATQDLQEALEVVFGSCHVGYSIAGGEIKTWRK